MREHIKNVKLYLFVLMMIPYIIIRAIVSALIKIDSWNDRVIDKFKLDTKGDYEEDDFARANRENKLTKTK